MTAGRREPITRAPEAERVTTPGRPADGRPMLHADQAPPGQLHRLGLRQLCAEEGGELLDGDASLANESAQGALRNLAMIWNRETPVRRLRMAQDDVAATLPIDFVAELAKSSGGRPPGDSRDRAHTATSTTSSSIAGGMASLRSLRLSR